MRTRPIASKTKFHRKVPCPAPKTLQILTAFILTGTRAIKKLTKLIKATMTIIRAMAIITNVALNVFL